MNLISIDKWINSFFDLNRANTKYGKAPHKPILLISLIDAFEKGLFYENKIFINAEFVALFYSNWAYLVNTGNTADITLPIFHLQNDQKEGRNWWLIKTKKGYTFDEVEKSFNKLTEVVDYAYLDDDLFLGFQNKDFRYKVKDSLLKFFFPKTSNDLIFQKSKKSKFLELVENEELSKNYGQPIKKLRLKKEQEIFIRGEIFRNVIPEIYLYTCAFSGWKFSSKSGYSLVEACHIIPFSKMQDDYIQNGISLCPNLHSAFDRGFITIDEEYRIITSPQIIELSEHPYSLRKLEGKKMLLPENKKLYPSQEKFKHHREEIFKT